MTEVNMRYNDYINESVGEIQFELIKNTILNLKPEDEFLKISMSDKITDNTELSGKLDIDGLNTLIKTLTILRNQIRREIEE